ncbi:hypothetical protein P170DRAFT_440019 [Aspergillus steynii IBT 23096]|uniref:Cell surface protein n=1 Tax=Aspergillus steynii IBT 23096 TaxID=1392250 RepID=A0A2I2FVU9_9EURO|nr:uncharacterized protein P170DRAFT_440019 [Aspergillus steynii IBT 23096]PLB44773.1 hypothetical protein P170DRAFT_440019 [Aspergillus steynii IBT 23096]
MSGILHKVKEAVTHHGHHHETPNKSHAEPTNQTYNQTPTTTHTDGYGANTTTSGPYLHGDEKPTYNAPMGDDGISPRTSTVNTSQPQNTGDKPSNVANKADPRGDNDKANAKAKDDISRFYDEVRQGSIGGAGVIHASGSNGPTTTKTFDPQASLGKGGGAQVHSSSAAGSSYNTNAPGSGSASQTTGPHGSDVANKVDPRVDSDLDGSRTVGAQRDGY